MSASRHTYAVVLKVGHVTITDDWAKACHFEETGGFNTCRVIIFDGDELAVYGNKKDADRIASDMNRQFGDHYEVITLR